jgi:L-ascorbate metabolism protein UlaG (beta-lactamase superfamily)
VDLASTRWAANGLGGTKNGVRVRWLGTAGFAITHGDHTVLLDPYVTRASLAQCLLSPLAPDLEAIERHVPRADAIIVGHTHFDHALDVPMIAKRDDAVVFGSASARALCRSQGVVESRIDVIEPETQSPREREVGPFHLRFHASAHSNLLLGRVPFPGEIQDCGDIPLRAERYRCGSVFGVEIRVAGRTIFHLGSAELVESALPPLSVDLALVCVAGWTWTARFPTRVVRALSPRAILLSHWDNFLVPFERGAKALPALRMGTLIDGLERASRDTKIGTVELGHEVYV